MISDVTVLCMHGFCIAFSRLMMTQCGTALACGHTHMLLHSNAYARTYMHMHTNTHTQAYRCRQVGRVSQEGCFEGGQSGGWLVLGVAGSGGWI